MKIALITMDFPPSIGGVQIYLYEIASRLAKYYDLTVVTPVFAPPSAEEPFKRYLLSSAHPFEYIMRYMCECRCHTVYRLYHTDTHRIIIGSVIIFRNCRGLNC